MLSWLKWGMIVLGTAIALILKHLSKILVVALLVYAIVEWRYPALPDIEDLKKWFLGLDLAIQGQLLIVVTMIFGFMFHHSSAVAADKKKHVISIKTKLAENLALLTSQMCQVAIDVSLYCHILIRLKEKLESSQSDNEKQFHWDYAYKQCNSYGVKIEPIFELGKKLYSLRTMYSSFLAQLGLEDDMECLADIVGEFSNAIIPIINSIDNCSDKEGFVKGTNFLWSFNLEAIKGLAEDCNIEIGAVSGGIRSDLVSELHSPTVRLLWIFLTKPMIFVGGGNKQKEGCFAHVVEERRSAIEAERKALFAERE